MLKVEKSIRLSVKPHWNLVLHTKILFDWNHTRVLTVVPGTITILHNYLV